MIPIRDANPSGSRPVITVALILANTLAFTYELAQGPQLERFIRTYGLIPARVLDVVHQPGTSLEDAVIVPLFASMFLHGGWLHLLSNMWYLWLFGDNVEDRVGHLRFLGFYLLCGTGAAATQVVLNPGSQQPMVGASGAIAGVLGAYMLCFPLARILTVVPILFFIQLIELPAFIVLFFWFVLQFFSGAAAITSQGGGGVAWWAHVGGFLAGMFLIRLLPRSRGSRQQHYRTRLDR